MKRILLLILLFLPLSVITFTAPPMDFKNLRGSDGENGYVLNSENKRVSLSGSSAPLTLYLDAKFPTQYYSDVRTAIATWETAIGHKVFDLQSEPLQASEPAQDGKSVIYWLDKWDSSIANQQGNTTIYWNGSTITEADIRIDALYYSFSDDPDKTQVDIQSLLLHELGHALGFKHDDGNQSVMATYLDSSFKRRHLYASDFARLQFEYPAPEQKLASGRKIALTRSFPNLFK